MALSEIERRYVLAATGVQSVEITDGGDTLAVQLYEADGGETCVLLPIGVVGELLFQLAETMVASPQSASQSSR
ncbi:hypothetical protein [Methylobacterium sp. CM6246]